MTFRETVLFRFLHWVKGLLKRFKWAISARNENLNYKILMLGIQQFRQEWLVKHLQKKKRINVVFFAASLSQWRYQRVYELMNKNPRLCCSIIVEPFRHYPTEVKELERKILCHFFESKQISYIDYYSLSKRERKIRKTLKPDILFYTQPYQHMYDCNTEWESFTDRLIIFCEYGFKSEKLDFAVDMPAFNLAWKQYYSTEEGKKLSITMSDIRGKNVVVSGYTNADEYLKKDHKDVWKIQSSKKKRVIWAPHFTIDKERSAIQHSSFLEMADFMLGIATEYKDRIQFAFKPHPKLLVELYAHKDWGKEKANEYYKKWETMDNTQLEQGEFTDLFMTSDGMIHDCASFLIEYHYTKKPVLYTSPDPHAYLENLNDIATRALGLHYWGKTEKEVRGFLDEIVLQNNHVKRGEQEAFFEQYLLPPNQRSVAENIVYDISTELIL